ncbi:MAG: 50S ribosomal protein L14 [candidate division WS6 bacterium GW2011_GWA2_37_6]|uniref:Large ribosomal subunit protein uL14 n=1 Tax=candidate division WS6 bacterium GW2011_GWA2_37_6 TaxID=1619087 RepID=A0A0G0K5I6_9BACT|nr:MAG: 50S ribosomal protein L14 [candidate division WS6 bacterium GW2011_GWA2_37_6]
MVQSQTRLKVADNSGVKEIMVIQVLGRAKGGKYQRFAGVGEIVSASTKHVQPDSDYKQGEVIHAVVVRVTKETRRKDGSYIRFDDNAAVIINKDNKEPKATRIFGPIARELKEKGFNKIVSLAPEVL